MRNKRRFCAALLCAALLTGCGQTATVTENSDESTTTTSAQAGEAYMEENVITEAVTEVPTEPPLITVTELPRQHQIDVPALLQNPELPAGCEITSLTCLLNYLGYPVDKVVMADTYLDYVTENGTNYTFFEKYIGSPHSNGYGCYSPVIMKAATEFLADQNSSLKPVNLSGSTQEELLMAVASGHPIVIWNTMGSSSVYEDLVWTTPDGEDVYWCILEHCMLLTGYDLEANTVTVCDPLNGVMAYDLTQFFAVYDDMYQQAMTIY
ncbi:MAG: C39 family peptidase [Ruminococcus sp.]|nr:C39 family peptidase [Ruminococcus sp.]